MTDELMQAEREEEGRGGPWSMRMLREVLGPGGVLIGGDIVEKQCLQDSADNSNLVIVGYVTQVNPV